MEPGSDELLARAAERANIAHTIFMLIDSDADGMVAVEHLGSMLTSMMLSQEVKYDGDVENLVQNMTRHRSPPERLVQITFNDFVDLYNSLVDRAKLQQYATTSYPQGSAVSAAVALSRNSSAWASGGNGVGASTQAEPPAPPPVPTPPVRRHGAGAAYLVSGAALKAVNGVYSQSGESDGVPKYLYSRYTLLRRSVSGGTRFWYVTDSATSVCYYSCRSAAGTPPLEVQWERGTDGLLPGPFLTPISMTHAPPTSVLAPLTTLEVGDYLRGDWAGRGVLYPGEVLAMNREDDTVDLLYDDGDFESHVPRERLHAVSIELTDSFHSFSVSDVVKVDLKGHGAWYTGRVIAIDTKFRVFTVKYQNGHLEKHVPPSRVQPLSSAHIKSDYVRGDRVRANWQSCGTWCLGRIQSADLLEGTFNVQYDDGEIETQIPPHSLQSADEAEAKVEEALPFACHLMGKTLPPVPAPADRAAA